MQNTDNISLIIGILGIVLAIIFYIKSKKNKRISYCTKSFVLISDTVSSLTGFSAVYQGEPLERLKATKVLLWNSGSEIIQREDFASTSKLALLFTEDCHILEASLTGFSNETNQSMVLINSSVKNEINIDFEYLAKGEGLVISVLHTSPEDNPNIVGTIKGAGNPIIFSGRKWPNILSKALLTSAGAGTAVAIQKTGFSALWLLAPAIVILIVFCVNFLEKIQKKRSQPKLDSIFENSFEAKDFS